MKKIIYIIALAALMVCACTNDNFNEADFVTQISSVSLTVKGAEVMKYDNSVHQLAWNDEKMQFRMMDDSLGNFFVVTLNKMPSVEGETVGAELVYTTYTSIKTVSSTFNVSKISGRYYWLWEPDTDTGVVIQELN